MLHVCCVNAGNYEGRGAQYVNTLHDMVRRNLPEGLEGEFVCFTDDGTGLDEGIVVRPLPAPFLNGWWHKLSLFEHDLFPIGDMVLYFDLDTCIVGPLDDIANYKDNFAVLRDVYRPHEINSGVMMWKSGFADYIWNHYAVMDFPEDIKGGDQKFIEQIAFGYDLWQDVLPSQFVSFKEHARMGIPPNSRVVYFHGKPRPHEITSDWVPKVWKVGGGVSAELVLVPNVPCETISNNIKASMERKSEWMKVSDPHDGVALICAGGPSLQDELSSIRAHVMRGAKVFAVNAAYHYLVSRHIEPDGHVMADARPQNVTFLPYIGDDCTRYYCSQCDPEVLDGAGPTLELFHPYYDGVHEITGTLHTGCYIGGGSTSGLKAVALAFGLGYREIHLYGFDSSYRGNENHAYQQKLNEGERIIDVETEDGTKFKCAPWMVTQAEDFMSLTNELTALGCVIGVHGDGLLPHIASKAHESTESAEIRAKEILKRIEDVEKPIVAEIGVFVGELSRRLLGRRPDLRLYMIDAWGKNQKEEFVETGDYHSTLSQTEQDECFKTAKATTAFAIGRTEIIRDMSTEAAKQIPDNSLDLAFIDADHSYGGCKADLESYYGKIKPGGILCGHDYDHETFVFGPMVKKAVDEFISTKGLHLELGENMTWFARKPKESVHVE